MRGWLSTAAALPTLLLRPHHTTAATPSAAMLPPMLLAVHHSVALRLQSLCWPLQLRKERCPGSICCSLLSHGGLKQQLHDCSSIDALRVLLKSLAAAGELPRPAALSQALPAGSQPTSVAAAAAPAAITAPTAAAPAVLVPMTTAAAAGGEAAPASAAPSEEAAPPALQAVEAEGGMQSFSGVLVSANSSFKARLKLPVDSADRLSGGLQLSSSGVQVWLVCFMAGLRPSPRSPHACKAPVLRHSAAAPPPALQHLLPVR